MFSRYIHGTKEMLFSFFCLGLMLLKVMLYDHFTVRQLVFSVLMLAVGALTYWGTGNILYFSLMVVVIASKDVDFDKIVSVWLVVVITIMFLAFVASQLNIIPNLRYVALDFFKRKKIIRDSFGIIYPTDCAAHVFFCLLSLFYLRRNYLKWYDFVSGLIAGILVYYCCKAKLDALSIFLTTVLFFIAYIFKHNKLWEKIWSVIGPVITPIACAFMIALTYAYKPEGVLERLNNIISRRLSYGKAGIDEYGIPIWGQKLKLIGHGGTTEEIHYHYNFLDVSYVNILVTSGIAFLSTFMIIYFIIAYIHRKKTFLLCALSMVAFNCAIAHHMTAIEYNVFTLALFATVAGKEYEDKII